MASPDEASDSDAAKLSLEAQEAQIAALTQRLADVEQQQADLLLADASKFPGKGIARVCSATDLAAVVTEPAADPTTLGLLEESGVEVLTTTEARP